MVNMDTNFNNFRYKIADKIKPKDTNSVALEEKKAGTNVLENLRKIGINAHKLSINAIRNNATYKALKAIQDLDLQYMCGPASFHLLDTSLTVAQFKELVSKNGIVLTYHGYLLERANLIVNLIHSNAVPYGRGGDFPEYSDKVISFNQIAINFSHMIATKVNNCAIGVDLMYLSALAILTYSWYDKDMSLNDVLVYVGNTSNNQFSGFKDDEM